MEVDDQSDEVKIAPPSPVSTRKTSDESTDLKPIKRSKNDSSSFKGVEFT